MPSQVSALSLSPGDIAVQLSVRIKILYLPKAVFRLLYGLHVHWTGFEVGSN